MALSAPVLETSGSGSGTSSLIANTSAWARPLTQGRTYFIFVSIYESGADTTPPSISLSGLSETFTEIQNTRWGADDENRIACFWFSIEGNPPANGVITISHNDSSVSLALHAVFSIDGSLASSPVGVSNASLGSDATTDVSLAAFADAANATIMVGDNEEGQLSTSDGGATELFDDAGFFIQYELGNDTNPQAHTASDTEHAAIAFEVKAAPAQTATPDTIGTGASIPQPTVSVSAAAQTVIPNFITATGQVRSPVVSQSALGQTVNPNNVTTGESVSEPRLDLVIYPSDVNTGVVVPNPSLTIYILPGDHASEAVVYQPVVQSTTWFITPDTIPTNEQFFNPSIVVGAVTILPNTIPSDAFVFRPRFQGAASPTIGLAPNSSSILTARPKPGRSDIA